MNPYFDTSHVRIGHIRLNNFPPLSFPLYPPQGRWNSKYICRFLISMPKNCAVPIRLFHFFNMLWGKHK